jgi:hypothetical protein
VISGLGVEFGLPLAAHFVRDGIYDGLGDGFLCHVGVSLAKTGFPVVIVWPRLLPS